MKSQNLHSIPEFYANKVIFVTGGLGFLGKVIVEKLLRSCPDIDKIYLLARAKKGKNVNERLEGYIKSPAFDLIREKNPDFLKKIVLIKGDISDDNLGMSEADQKLFLENVNVIIHSAATLSYNEPLKLAINSNVKAMKTLLGFTRKMKNLDCFVHISTAYTGWFLPASKEQFHPMKHDPNELIEMARTTDQESMQKLLPSIIGKHANTYILTKSLSETLISKEAHGIPMCIVRPSMIISCHSEPKPGWVDSWAAKSYYCYITSLGLMRAIHTIEEQVCDLVCADMVSNVAIAAGWNTALERKNSSAQRQKLPTIYNCTSRTENPIYWNYFWNTIIKNGREYPLENVIFYPRLKLRRTFLTANTDIFLKQMIPAYIIDAVTKIIGGKPKLVKAQKLYISNLADVRFSTINPCVFPSENVPKLRNSMNANDQKTFDFDFRKINYDKTLLDYHMGIRRYLAKQDDSSLPVARKRLARLKFINYAVIGSIVAVSLIAAGGLAKVLLKKRNENDLK